MKDYAKSNRDSASSRSDSAWEREEEFLEFLSDVQGQVAKASLELRADFRLEIAPPESIDGDESAPQALSFFICMRKDNFPSGSYCLYTRLEPKVLRAYAGKYEMGKVSTIRELSALYKLDGAGVALQGWLGEVQRLSMDNGPENA